MKFFKKEAEKSGKLIKVLMKTGKHKDLVVTVLDIPFVVEHLNENGIRILLPGFKGEGTILSSKPKNN